MALTRVPSNMIVTAMSRAEALLLTDTTAYTVLAVHYGGVLCYYEKDVAGTALTTADGQNWKPAGSMPITAEHFGNVTQVGLNAAITEAARRGGGHVYLMYRTYFCTGDVVLGDANEVGLVGQGPGASILDFTGGGKLVVKTAFDIVLRDFSVQNGTGDNIVIGETTGAQASQAWFSVENVTTSNAGARGLAIGDAYMGTLTNVRSFNAGTIGIDVSTGFNTSLTFIGCHALGAGTDGWYLRNIVYSNLDSCGADGAGQYGYRMQGVASLVMSGCGCETAVRSAFLFHNNASSGDLIAKFYSVKIDGFFSTGNATGGAGYGELAHFTSVAGAQDAGSISFRGTTMINQTQAAFDIDGGAYRIICPANENHMDRSTVGASFSVILDGAQDFATGLPVNVTGANTPIATIVSKLDNGIQAFGGLITVYASKNNLASGSKSATYLLLLCEYSGGDQIVEVSKAGLTSGAAADEASFTFAFDAPNNHLEVTPVGSTGTGNWYFYITAANNLSVSAP